MGNVKAINLLDEASEAASSDQLILKILMIQHSLYTLDDTLENPGVRPFSRKVEI